MLKLLTGEACGRIITFVAAPIITRLYTPSDMGTLAVFNSLIAVITPFCCLKYSLAIPVVANNRILINLIGLSLLILLFTTGLTIGIFGLFGNELLSFLNMEKLIPYWYLIPISFLFIGFFEILSNLCIRDKKFTLYASTSVYQKLLGSGMKIGLGFLNLRPLGLLIGDLINQIGGISVLFKSFWKNYKTESFAFSKSKLSYVWRYFSAFPKFRVPSQVFLALSGSLPILFFSWKFDGTVTGEISLARTMLSIPITFLGASIGKAFYGEIVQIGGENIKQIRTLTKSVIIKLFALSFIPFSVILIGGPYIFQFVFGAKWYEAGVYARIMSCYLIFQFIYSPISEGLFNVCRKQKLIFLLEFSRIFLVISALGVSTIFNLSPFPTILFYSIALALQYIISIIVVFRIVSSK